MALKTKRITTTSNLSKILDEGGWTPVPEAETRELEKAIRRSHEARQRGGSRPGAGRKPLGKVRLETRIRPETLARLKKQAGGARGIGAVIDRLVAKG